MFPFYTERAPENGDLFVPLARRTTRRLSICSNVIYTWVGDKNEAHSVWPQKYDSSITNALGKDLGGSFLSCWDDKNWAMLVWRGRYDNEPYLNRTTLGIKVHGSFLGGLPVEPKAKFVALSTCKATIYTFSANEALTLGLDTYRYIPQEWVGALL